MHGISHFSGFQQFANHDFSSTRVREGRQFQPQAYEPRSTRGQRYGGGNTEYHPGRYDGGRFDQLGARAATKIFSAKLLAVSGTEINQNTNSGYGGGRGAVVSNFLSNVAGQLSKATSTEEAVSIIDRAREQIGEARSAVDDLDIGLSDRADRRLAKLENRLNKGLDNLADQFIRPEPQYITTSQASVNYSAEAKAVLDIKTQDGDSVSLRFQSSSALKADATYVNEGFSEVSDANVFVSSDSRLRIEIDGNLDEGEVEAIKGVLSQIDNIAQSFFGGDIEKAIAGLQDFSFDDSELSSVGLDLALRQEITVRQTETTTEYTPAFAPSPLASPSIKPVQDKQDDVDKADALPKAEDLKPVKEKEDAAPAIEKPIEVAEVEAEPIVAPLPTAGGVEELRQATIKQVSTEISEFFSAQFNITNGNIESFVEQSSVSQILSTIVGVREQTQAASPVAVTDKTAESKAA